MAMIVGFHTVMVHKSIGIRRKRKGAQSFAGLSYRTFPIGSGTGADFRKKADDLSKRTEQIGSVTGRRNTTFGDVLRRVHRGHSKKKINSGLQNMQIRAGKKFYY